MGATLAIAACGNGDQHEAPTSQDVTGAEAAASLQVVVPLYPLQFVVERVGGTLVEVRNLTPAGVEPHELELTPRETASLRSADLVVFLSGFAPAVDRALEGVAPARLLDVTSAAHLEPDESIELSLDGMHDDGHDDHDHDNDGDHDHHDHGGADPHFWLDPARLADVADAVAAGLGRLNADSAPTVSANAAVLRAELDALDLEFTAGLASCASTYIVTSHSAFRYLAQRYGLTQVGISGLAPDEEPTPAKFAQITTFVRDQDVTTIYYETLVDPAIATTIAHETGAATAVLDPIEGLTEGSPGADYFEIMRANLATLRTGQTCT